MHPLVGLGGGWGQNVTKHYTTYNGNKTPIPPPPPPPKKKREKKKKRVRDDDSDTDSDNEIPVKVSVNKTLNSSRGVIRCRDLADMSEVEIRDELKD